MLGCICSLSCLDVLEKKGHPAIKQRLVTPQLCGWMRLLYLQFGHPLYQGTSLLVGLFASWWFSFEYQLLETSANRADIFCFGTGEGNGREPHKKHSRTIHWYASPSLRGSGQDTGGVGLIVTQTPAHLKPAH